VTVFEHGNCYMPAMLVYKSPIVAWTHIAVVYDNRLLTPPNDGTDSRHATGVRYETGSRGDTLLLCGQISLIVVQPNLLTIIGFTVALDLPMCFRRMKKVQPLDADV